MNPSTVPHRIVPDAGSLSNTTAARDPAGSGRDRGSATRRISEAQLEAARRVMERAWKAAATSRSVQAHAPAPPTDGAP